MTSRAKSEATIRHVIRRWLCVAQELEKLNNIHCLCAVVGALHNSLTPEIRPLWDKIPEPIIQWFIATRSHFVQHVEQLRQHHLCLTLPCIPHFAIYRGLSHEYANLRPPLFKLSSISSVGELISNFQRYA